MADWARRLRVVTVLLLGAYMLLGPGYRQVLGGSSPLVRNWVMYAGFARNTCDVQLLEHRDDGEVVPVDRFELLGKGPWYAQARPKRMVLRSKLRRTLSEVCRLAERPESMRARVRCGSRSTWEQVHDGQEPICAAREAP